MRLRLKGLEREWSMRNRLLLLALFFFSPLFGTNVSGVISSNTTWSIANSPYIYWRYWDCFRITLTIDEGVSEIQIKKFLLMVQGTVICSSGDCCCLKKQI